MTIQGLRLFVGNGGMDPYSSLYTTILDIYVYIYIYGSMFFHSVIPYYQPRSCR